MRRLNPYSWILKTQARANNLRRRRAREILRRRKAGEKVDPKALDKATQLLGIKLRKYKEYMYCSTVQEYSTICKLEKSKKAAAEKGQKK